MWKSATLGDNQRSRRTATSLVINLQADVIAVLDNADMTLVAEYYRVPVMACPDLCQRMTLSIHINARDR